MKRLALFASLILCACATAPPKPEPPEAPRARAMAVHSIPTGCLVDLNGEWVGITPCTVMIPSDSAGGFRGVDLRVMKVEPVTGGLGDIKTWWPGQRIPARSVFRIPWAPRQPEKKADLVVAP
jgi:PEGA domain